MGTRLPSLAPDALSTFREPTMSAIGGIYHFDDAPVDEPLLAALGEALTARAPHGGDETRSGSLGMVYRAFHTNVESRLERQPLVSPNGCMLTWDGRLDNRQELLTLLSEEVRGLRTDVEIVMAAYVRWGSDFLPRITGDFALALWDQPSKMLLLARDLVGTRTLFYQMNHGKIIWSSELAPLLSLAGVKLEIDDEYVTDFLVNEVEPSRTPYQGVHAVPPGKVVTVSGGQLRVKRFWAPDPKREIRYQSDAEYEEHFRHLFQQAVGCRLRVEGGVWAELSGGLDSSSIVCLADHILKMGETQASNLETISYVYEASPTSDERVFIRSVEEHVGKPGHHLREAEQKILAPLDHAISVNIPNPLYCFAGRYRELRNAMRDGGARVLLSGVGGDHLLLSQVDASPELADLLLQLKPFCLHHQTRAWSQAQGKPYLEQMWKGAIWPVLPRKVKERWGVTQRLPKLLAPDFVTRANIHERLHRTPDTFGFQLPSRRHQVASLSAAISLVSSGYYQDICPIEVSYPFLDRPLIEFMLAIPFEQILRPGERRSLQRRALVGLLPEKIRERKGKRGPDEAFYRALVREWSHWERVFSDARACALGYIDPQALRQALESARHGREVYTYALLKTLSLELWLRSLDRRYTAAINDGCLHQRLAQ